MRLTIFTAALAASPALAYPGMKSTLSEIHARAKGGGAPGDEQLDSNELIGDLSTLEESKLSPVGKQIKSLITGSGNPESDETYPRGPWGAINLPNKGSAACAKDTCCIWKYVADDMVKAFRGSGARDDVYDRPRAPQPAAARDRHGRLPDRAVREQDHQAARPDGPDRRPHHQPAALRRPFARRRPAGQHPRSVGRPVLQGDARQRPARVFKFASDIVLAKDPRISKEFNEFAGPGGQQHWNADYAREYIRLSLLGVFNINDLTECTKALPGKVGAFVAPDQAAMDKWMSTKNKVDALADALRKGDPLGGGNGNWDWLKNVFRW
ncbi:ligninase H2 [Magnaporthiopsis poae ATCC 64411]|uniref:Ligninase H2 n=1 Tax=Magnaporthiopsis poae (strain ATCC 64411 / 73-15) TaxID=644358 RepID=A0A0C4DVY3_MAGP6|nr:ligninase H2 [Magnaporthiopsis poae ATCC 64411]